jgi:hypothetical protein
MMDEIGKVIDYFPEFEFEGALLDYERPETI